LILVASIFVLLWITVAGVALLLALRANGLHQPTRSILSCILALALHASGVFAVGWHVGGRPPGWYEGKALFGGLVLLGAVCALIAIAVVAHSLWSCASAASADSPRGVVVRHHLIAIGTAVITGIVTIIFTLFSMSLVYKVAQWRQDAWYY
jgi:hypothetical protein